MTHSLFEVAGDLIMVSDPDRRPLGDAGPTKRELLAYYVEMAPRMLGFLRGRSTSAILLPDETQEFRFARTAPAGCVGRFPTCEFHCSYPTRTERYLTVPDCGTLAALVSYGCVSFHPWSSMAVAPSQPTHIVFNLDPEAIAFREVRNAALLLRELVGAYGLAAWVKTSGGQGVHVIVPFTGSVSFDDTRLAAETIVKRALRREPKLFSRDPRAARRRGRILLDTSRNARGATIIAPYGLATSGLVSAPLEWEELGRPLYPEDFDMPRVLARGDVAERHRAAFVGADQSLEPLLQNAGGYRRRADGFPGRQTDVRELPGDTGAMSEEAQRLRAENRRVRDEAEVTRIESANIRYRAQKVREERRALPTKR
jgi:bifunctional non-homologous end joining protein LigD